MGDNVSGGAQVIRSAAASLGDLRADVSRQVRFEPADYNQIVYMQFLNTTFNEWVPVAGDLQGLTNDAKIHLSCEKNTFSPLQAAFLGSVVEVFLEKVSQTDAQNIRQALVEAMALLKGGGMAVCEVEGTAAFRTVADLIRSLAASVTQAVAPLTPGRLAQQQVSLSQHGSASNTPRSGTKAAPPSTKAKMTKSSRPTSAGAADESSAAVASVRRHLPPSVLPSVSSAPAVSGSDDITIYCVYSGTTTQRAKAIRSSRSNPSLESLLATLRTKFNADLTLGHIDESGTCTEVLSSLELRAIIATRAAFDSLTLHCWARATVSFDEDSSGTGGGALITRSDVQGDASSVASSGGGLKRGRPVKSSRPASANSSRNSSIAKRKVGKVTPSFPNDASGVAWTPEQIEELFHAVDVDGSGYLTKAEMMDYWRANHDSMGVVDAESKFAAFLDNSTEMSDGMITLQEFGLVMLKLAQW